MQSNKQHWNTIYKNKGPNEVSWFQKEPTISIELIQKLKLNRNASIIDVGAGDSLLVDFLITEGFSDITVLDISENAIAKAKARLGSQAKKVKWVVSNILDFKSEKGFDIWHDRATFHFLTSETEISTYLDSMNKYVNTKGKVILGTFSETGPNKCSGITITQYSEKTLTELLTTTFKKQNCRSHDHITPFETIQNFIFCTFQKI